MDKRPIGILDSGIGGLTIFSELRKNLANEEFIYFGDTINFPYGPKNKEEIVEITKKNIESLIKKEYKLIIIACGTASSQALDEVKNIYDIPIIGIINPTIEKVLQGNRAVIGIIATEGTIRSKAWEIAIREKDKDSKVVSKACPLLARMAEEDFKKEEVKQAIKIYLEPFKNTDVEKLILGCTHYPIFRELIEMELENRVEIMDTASIVCEYVKNMLCKDNLGNDKNNLGDYKVLLTNMECNFAKIAKRLFNIEESKIYLERIF